MIATVRQALALEDFDVRSAQMKLAPMPRPMKRPFDKAGTARVGSVLLLLFCHENVLYVTLTRRRANLNAHGGQISFPGGRNEPSELLQATALRETEEEVGIPATEIEVLGTLTTIYIPPSDFIVHPFVGWVKNGSRPIFAPSPSEVDEVLEVPIALLLDPANFQSEIRTVLNGVQVNVPFFNVNGDQVWGGTAVILSEFLERFKATQEL